MAQEIYRELKSSYEFRFADNRPNPVSHIAIYFPGFCQDAEMLKSYCVQKGYVDKNVERSYCITEHRIKNGAPRRFLSFQSFGDNVSLILQQVERIIAENHGILVKISLLGHSMGAVYARTCLKLLVAQYPLLHFELREFALPSFAWGVFLHRSFLLGGGIIGTFHALLMMLLCTLTLGYVTRFRGYRTPGFAINGLFLNNLVDHETAQIIAKNSPADATLAYLQVALLYGIFSAFRLSEVKEARLRGWKGKHFVYAAKDDRVFRYADIVTYAHQHSIEVIPLDQGYSEFVLSHVKEGCKSSFVTHCPFY